MRGITQRRWRQLRAGSSCAPSSTASGGDALNKATATSVPAFSDPLGTIGLSELMGVSRGSRELVVGLLDGPVATNHPDLTEVAISQDLTSVPARCSRPQSIACTHGTAVAGILVAARSSAAPAICPGCTLLVHPIFKEATPTAGALPSVDSPELARAVVRCIDAGARVLNLSAAFDRPSTKDERLLTQALDYAARRGVIVVAAAGNQGTLGSSGITRHPWVIPVVGCDAKGRPTSESNLGSSVGRRGLMAPGESITSLGTDGKPTRLGGTSVAAPFVTGAVALLWSVFPDAGVVEVKNALIGSARVRRRATIVPPLLDVGAAYRMMAASRRGKEVLI